MSCCVPDLLILQNIEEKPASVGSNFVTAEQSGSLGICLGVRCGCSACLTGMNASLCTCVWMWDIIACISADSISVRICRAFLSGMKLMTIHEIYCALQGTMLSYVGTMPTQIPSSCKILLPAAATSQSHQPFLRMHGKHMEPTKTCSLSLWLKGRSHLQTYTKSRFMARPLFVSGVVVRPPH